MLKIWNTVDMETVADYVNREYIINFAETIINDKLVQHGPAGRSRFRKALEVLANHDFEVYKMLNNEPYYTFFASVKWW